MKDRRLIPSCGKCLFVFGFTLLVLCSETAVAQNLANEVFKRMDENKNTLSTLEASLTRVKINKQLGGIVDTDSGALIYAAANPKKKIPMMIRVDFNKPRESFSIVKNVYVVYSPGSNQAWTGNTANVSNKNKQANLFAFFRMSRMELKQNFIAKYLGKATVRGGIETDHLELTPIGQATYSTAEIWVDKVGMPVQTMINEKNSDSTTILLSNIVPNKTINASRFEIKIAEKTKVHEEK